MTAINAAVRNRGGDFARNVGILAALWIAYSAVRSVTADDLGTAMTNASDLLTFQQTIGLPSELNLQNDVIDKLGLIRGANTYYIAVHFPLTIAFLGWAWLKHRSHFDRIRNTLIGVTGVGMILHALYPLAPPRMITGFVDTAATFGPDPYSLGISGAANQIAAMPSLHVGWALLVSLGVIWISDSPHRWLALAHPIITVMVVILTANHYWTDAIVAAALVGVGWMMFGSNIEDEHTRPMPALAAIPPTRSHVLQESTR